MTFIKSFSEWEEMNPEVCCPVCRGVFFNNRIANNAIKYHMDECLEKYGGRDGYLSFLRQEKMDILEFNKKIREQQKKFSL